MVSHPGELHLRQGNPVRWVHDPETKVNMIHDSLRVLGEVLSTRPELAPGPVSPRPGLP